MGLDLASEELTLSLKASFYGFVVALFMGRFICALFSCSSCHLRLSYNC